MEPEQPVQLEHILQHMSVGVAILDCSDLCVRYINPYLQSLLEQVEQPRRLREAIGHCLQELLPGEYYKVVLPLLQQVSTTGKRKMWPDIPFEGFLAARGRTYWRVVVERATSTTEQTNSGDRQPQAENRLIITVEDVTELARSRLYVDAIQSISSAIVGPYALPLVLDRILQAVQEMVGSTRCAIILLDSSVSNIEFRYPGFEKQGHKEPPLLPEAPPTATIAAQKGVHLRSQDWHPQVSEQLLPPWLAVVMVSVFGTVAADVVHVGFGVPYAVSTVAFAVALTAIFVVWYRSQRTLSIHSIHTRRRPCSGPSRADRESRALR